MVSKLLDYLDELGIADNTIVLYSTDNGPHYNSWPDAGTTPFHGEKNSNWEGAYRVPAFIKWPGHFPKDVTLNGIVSHEDWLPTFAAAAGNDNVIDQLKKGTTLNGRSYKNHIDGANQLDYLTGKSKESAREGFVYVTDGGEVAALRYNDWKVTFLERRAKQLQIWLEPFVHLRAPYLFNLRRDPFEKALEGSNTYYDWYISHAFIITPIQQYAIKFLSTFREFPPSQTAGDWSLTKVQKQVEEMNSKSN